MACLPPPSGALWRISAQLLDPHDTLAHAGEKRLKSLLSKTRQWRSPAERAVAAAACDASGYENLARVLRNDVTSAALRKRDMIALARLWKYRSHIWRCVLELRAVADARLRAASALRISRAALLMLRRMRPTQASRDPRPR